MSTAVSYIGNSYSIPAYNDTGYAQGPGNLSAYLIALATGNLTLSGGAFPLTTDANFGANFGLVSIYYKSRTASISTAGILRLANVDTIGWRNVLNNGNLLLAVNGSDQLTFNGTVIGLVGGSVTSVSGTSNQINSSGGTTPVLSLSSTLIVPGTFTIPAVTNQIILGTTNTVTLTSPAPAASRVYTFPDVLGAASFVMTAGTQSIAGAKTFTDPITQDDTTNQIVLGTTRTITISAPTPASSSRVVTIPDPGAAADFVLSEATATINGTKTFAGQLIGKGTATNNSAAAGYIGEYIESAAAGNTNAAASDVYDDLTSISLTAGDWDVTGMLIWTNNTAAWTEAYAAITVTAGNNTTGMIIGSNVMLALFASSTTTPLGVPLIIPSYRLSLSGTTTVYLKRKVVYTTNTPRTIGYRLSARRMR